MSTRRPDKGPGLGGQAIFKLLILITSLYSTTAFNYDYSSACARPYRSGRVHNPVPIPCDLNKQSYCNLPGSGYPWHAVRRFVHENQGLMRRMYGEQRHISVLKAEIEHNDIESETYNLPIRPDTFSRSRKDQDILNTKFLYSKRPTGRSSDVHTIPHFRPVQTTPTSTVLKETKTHQTNANSKKDVNKTKKDNENSSVFDSMKGEKDKIKIAAYKTSFFDDEMSMQNVVKENLEMNKIEPEIISLEIAIKQSIESNSVFPSYGSAYQNISVYASTPLIVSESVSMDATTPEYTTASETTSPLDTTGDTTPSELDEEGWKPVAGDKVSTLPPTMLFSESVKNEQNIKDRVDTVSNEENRDPTESIASNLPSTASNVEGQLFQDVVQEETAKPIVKLRGVNACPVKEEVVAPFWANNTRGEVLALLNLYPFEQYVHWEKCTNEHKQMFCREGCRCEQQYRLHRLLAYDPNNECRGIFSDWFRFPSCCVCKCYDMPLEFRVTSRSPRTIQPELDETVKKQMYEHAASDWYTINIDE